MTDQYRNSLEQANSVLEGMVLFGANEWFLTEEMKALTSFSQTVPVINTPIVPD